MTFKQLFENTCGCPRDKFITVTEETFESITAKKLMSNCMKSQHPVMLTAFKNHGNAKVCDFNVDWTASDRPWLGSEDRFIIVFVKAGVN